MQLFLAFSPLGPNSHVPSNCRNEDLRGLCLAHTNLSCGGLISACNLLLKCSNPTTPCALFCIPCEPDTVAILGWAEFSSEAIDKGDLKASSQLE
ncbi:hypothetical protein C4D60_Mb05t29680 [Musa balbisiana]|uniref:Uncharacterized protein n=1 Tax=Musa balbisiana TaxID=52838 RepID=A0A4S8JZY7_MUSBA|nr:hypothetical protein C4D60_Mb05t29680 [Musa balbisiana]